MNIHYFNFNNQIIKYQLSIKNVKNINLRINSRGEISVSVPKSVSKDYLNTFLVNKGEWILNHLNKIKNSQLNTISSKVESGKKVFFIGNQYSLVIKQSQFSLVEIADTIITISTPYIDCQEKIKQQYLDWLHTNALPVFEDSIITMCQTISKYNIEKPMFTIRNMKTRWGSCFVSRKKIGLSLQLIKSPKSCIDYVVLHELIHFIHPNHSPNFYGVLTELMPDWKKRKDQLNTMFKDNI